MNVKDMFPSEFLRAIDFAKPDGTHSSSRVVLKSITKRELMNPRTFKQETKYIMFFRAHTKGLVLGKKKVEALVAAWGPETDQWIDKEAILFITSTALGPGLRLRPAPATAKCSTDAPEGAEDLSFQGDPA